MERTRVACRKPAHRPDRTPAEVVSWSFSRAISFVARAFDEQRIRMAEYGEWNRKGATLSDVTAEADYGVTRDFIIKGIQTARLEYRDGSIWGNPYLRLLRSQFEKYIGEELGEAYLVKVKNQAELRKVKKDISDLKKKLKALEGRKVDLVESLQEEG